jgi:tRNA-dihydrouridine synthase B
MIAPFFQGPPDRTPTLVAIGPFELRNNVLLAPMAGVTDVPFRALAWRYGAGHVVSEMVASQPGLWHTPKSRLRRRSVRGIHPLAVQIAGGDPETIAAAAVRHWRDGADVIDINFGCPAKKVCRKAAGSALLADVDLVRRIIAAATAAVPVPVTIKIRTGPSPDRRNGVEIARIAEGEGVSAIAVHGRTRACRFNGAVEYDTIAAIKGAVRIPVFANGDICDAAGAQRVLKHTAADGVMIGRAALGAPWLPGQIAGMTGPPGLAEKLAVMREHLAAGHVFYGTAGTRIMRKHIQWYVEKLDEMGDVEWRRAWLSAFNALTDAPAQLAHLDSLTPGLAA